MSYQGLGNSLQRQNESGKFRYRFALGADGFYYPVDQDDLDAELALRPPLPTGLFGQQLKVSEENTNHYLPVDPLIYSNFIYTDAQLTRALSAGSASQLEIFNSFKRFSFGQAGGGISNDLPADPSEMLSWSYDTGTNEIRSIINSGTQIGFISGPEDRFDSYTHKVTFSSTILAGDNDYMGVVLAFVEDPDDMVPNRAYGLTLPGINTTDPFIPNQHAITMMRGRNGAGDYSIYYDYRRSTQQLIADGTNLPGLFRTTANWAGQSVDVQIQRSINTFTVETSQFSDAPGGKGSLAFPLTFDLSSNPVLEKFEGKQSYGYASFSQGQASFSNVNFSGSRNIIYDLRNGDVYIFVGSSYILDPTRNLYTELGNRYFWRNPTELSFGYILPTNTYDVIVGAAS